MGDDLARFCGSTRASQRAEFGLPPAGYQHWDILVAINGASRSDDMLLDTSVTGDPPALAAVHLPTAVLAHSRPAAEAGGHSLDVPS